MALPIPVPPGFRIIAHRGASAYAPENSEAAFQLALEMGVMQVELDTQLTRDGVVALCHDSTLERYGHGPQVVEELTWAQLAALDMGSWFSPYLYGGTRMLTLADLFARYGDRLIYHVEIKGKAPGLPAAVARLIGEYALAEHCFVTSFAYTSLEEMHRVAPHLRLGWLVRNMDANTLAQAQALGLYQFCPVAGAASAAAVAKARSVAPEVRAWGLSGQNAGQQAAEVQALIYQVLEAGCDGMTINWPDWVVHRQAGSD
jgi:glycerophosphoryl diester phosphodiesterase